MAGIEPTATTLEPSVSNSSAIVPVQLGEVVLVKGEKIIGVVSYLGSVDWDIPSKQYVGLTLSDPVENGHNGTERGHRYFTCPQKHGLIIPSQHVSRTISPPELLQKVTTLNNAFKACYSQSQQLKQKYLKIRETLSRVQGENQNLRERLEYYERGNTAIYKNPYIAASRSSTPNLPQQQLNDPPQFILDTVNPISPTPISPTPISPTPMSPSPPPPQSNRPQLNNRPKSHKIRTFQPPLPPLPSYHENTSISVPASPALVHAEEYSKSFGIPTPLAMTAIANLNNQNKYPQKKKKKRKKKKKKKTSFKKQRVYRKRSNSNVSFKSFKSRASTYKSQRNSSYRNRSDISKSSMTSYHSHHSDPTLVESESYIDALDAANSPMPLSIGDDHGSKINIDAVQFGMTYSTNTLDLQIPSNASIKSDETKQTKYTLVNAEEESHDIHDDDGSDVILVEDENEILFPILKNAERHTNTPKIYSNGNQYISKFVPRDQEDIDDDDIMSKMSNTFENNNKYNHEEAELDIDQVTITSMSFTENTQNTRNTQNILVADNIKFPGVIKEESENEEQEQENYHKHLAPHIVEEDDDSDSRNMSSTEEPPINTMNTINDDDDDDASSESIEYQQDTFNMHHNEQIAPKFEQMDEDSDLEIESPHPPTNGGNIDIKTFEPQNNIIFSPKHQSMSHPLQRQQQSKPIHKILTPKSVATPWQTPLTPGDNVGITNNNRLHSVHSTQGTSIPDTVGLLADDVNIGRVLSDSQSGRYSNTPSYTPNSTKISDSQNQYNHGGRCMHLNNNQYNYKERYSTIKKRQSYINPQQIIKKSVIFSPDKKNQSLPVSNNDDKNNKNVHWIDNGINHDHHVDVDVDDVIDDDDDDSNSHHTPTSVNSMPFRRSPQHISVNTYGQNGNGNFQRITKRKSMMVSATKNNKKIKRRLSRSRTFVTTTNGRKYSVFEQQQNENEEEKSHQPIITPKQTPQQTPKRTPKQTPKQTPQQTPNYIGITLDDDFKLDHQQRNSMLPTSSPTMNNAASDHVAKDFHRKRKIYYNNNNNNNNNHIHVENVQFNMAMKSKSAPENINMNETDSPSPHRNLGSLTHTELKGLLEADNLFNYSGYPKIVQ